MTNTNKTTITTRQLVAFNYLNELRVSGVTNMWGASPYLESRLKLSTAEAGTLLSLWMKNFNDDGYNETTQIKH